MTPHPKQLRFKQNVYATKLFWMIVPYWLLIFFYFFFWTRQIIQLFTEFFLPLLGMSR